MIRAVATTAVSLLSTVAAQAAEPDAHAYETTVTSLRLPRPLRDAPSTVTVVPREELDRLPASGTDDVVRVVPSAATFRRTPSLVADPTAQGLNLRGVGPSGVSRALVLVDGVPANDPFGGWIYWRALPRLGLDRIEVAPGGTSALYGNYALGGVVHLVSRPIETGVQADVAGGSLRTGTVAARAAWRAGRVGGSLEGEALRSDGYVPVVPGTRGPIDRAAASRHGTLQSQLVLAASPTATVTARGALFDEDQNGGTRFTTAAVRSATYGVGVAWDPARVGRVDGTVFGSVERFQQTRARIAPGRLSEVLSAQQRTPSQSQGASVVVTGDPLDGLGRHVLLAGVDARRVRGQAREVLHPADDAPTAATGRRAGGEQQFAGMFVEELWSPHPALDVSLAARVDLWRNLDGRRTITRASGAVETTAFADRFARELSPRIAVLARASDDDRIRASAYRSFRAPTLNELYRPFQVGTVLTAANEALRAEHLVGGELGYERLLGQGSAARVTAFSSVLQDPIVNATLADTATRQRRNLGRASIRGAELSLDARLERHVSLNLGYTLADARVRSAPAQPQLVGKRLAQDPLHRGRVAVALTDARVVAAVQVRLQSRQFEDDLNQLPMDGHAVIDLFASVPLGGRLSAYATAQNLLDQRYLVGRAGVDTLGPPLLVMAGIRIR